MFILAATRTPFCKMGTDLADLTASDLGRAATSSLLTKTGIDPAEISEVIFGCFAQPLATSNIARIIALRSGIPENIPAMTVQRNCASGLEAITTAHQRISANLGDLFLVGGVESMSHIPLLFPHEAALHFAELNRAKNTGQKITAATHFNLSDFRPRMGIELALTDSYSGLLAGETAEIIARKFKITREAQDIFAANSHSKAIDQRHLIDSEISPIFHNGKAITSDNGIRPDSSHKNLAALQPAFDRKTGTITAGNSSQLTDGAVAMLVGTEQAAHRLGIQPLARLAAYTYTGCSPSHMGLGPVNAIARAKQIFHITPDDADIIEINEAFAAQVLAVIASLKNPSSHNLDLPPIEIPSEKLNRRGGSIALGHPIGATGARLVLTAIDQLHETNSHRALVSLCIGGGQGAALYLEKP